VGGRARPGHDKEGSHDTVSGGLLSSLPARLGATQITHTFLPGAVLSRALGRQDCLGATMCLHRDDLARTGGLQALAGHLADDNVLGRHIAALGLRVALADTVPLTTVPEATLKALFRHELRWARTIRALEPAAFAASVLQYKLAWALLAIVLAGGALWSIGFFLIAWVLAAVAALGVDSALAPLWTVSASIGEQTSERGSNDNAELAFCCPVWLLPLRDILSVAVMLASYGGRHVEWRGHGLQADTPPPLTGQSMTPRSIKGNDAR
jgi:ceramide glucosyltransferase